MSDVPERCRLYSVHRQRYVGAALCLLPASCGVFGLVPGLLLSHVAAVGVELAGLEIPRCLWLVPDFVQRLCLCGVVVETVTVHYG